MKIRKEKFSNRFSPSTILSFRYSTILLVIILILMLIIPKILNYAPESINTPFDVQMSKISYTTQFSLITIGIILGIVILTKILLKDVDKWFKNPKNITEADTERVREKCIKLPYIFLGIEIMVPFLVSMIILIFTGSHYPIMILKIILLLLAFAFLLAVISFVFSKKTYDKLLSLTYKDGMKFSVKISLRKKLFLLVFSTFLSGMILTSLVGYSVTIREKSNILFEIYKSNLEKVIDIDKKYTRKEIDTLFSKIDYIADSETRFILDSNNNVEIISGRDISNFTKEYTKQISYKYDGRIYDSYGIDSQGIAIQIDTTNGKCFIGILYDIFSGTALTYLIVNFILSVVIMSVMIKLITDSLSKDLLQISNGFENIVNDRHTTTILPVISNDEIGDLVTAFNKIQKLNSKQLDTIKSNQNTLIERERLASLGQMVGGIAHNLKTPIFSIAGGLEGLSDLIKEFDESIEDSNVTDEDMHEIAKDMKNWIVKLRGHTSYMSDVITTVKGQAVTLSEEQAIDFTVEEVFQHIKILMQHEIKHSLTTLDILNNIPNNIKLHGNINSLIQVINNLISNSIESYGNKVKEKTVKLSANFDGRTRSIIISVQDFGPGLPDIVKDKLFKEMVTTKGKDGTGIGLFMSYSNIKAHFKGDITFETEKGKGTIFYIKIPI